MGWELGDVTGILGVETSNAGKHPTVHRTTSQQKTIRTKAVNSAKAEKVCPCVILKIQYNTPCRGCGEKGTFLYCWWECKLVQPLWKTVWRFLKKLKVEFPYDPAI